MFVKVYPDNLSNTFLQNMRSHDLDAVRLHMFGLRELLKLHGGLGSLPLTLARHIRKYDVLC